MFKKYKVSDNLPEHIGIIMDGNGRWATKRGLARNLGHKAGIEAIKDTVQALLKLPIKYVTFFAFSTENWKRSKEEIDGIFELVRSYISSSEEEFDGNDVRVLSIGDLTPFPSDLVDALERVKEKTKNNKGLNVVFALNYGGHADILRAVNEALKDKKPPLRQEDIEKHLFTSEIGLPNPDFVIRTSGEQRLSNFMIYQMAYSELYFPKVLWPDFNEKELYKALEEYSKRERRFGGIK